MNKIAARVYDLPTKKVIYKAKREKDFQISQENVKEKSKEIQGNSSPTPIKQQIIFGRQGGERKNKDLATTQDIFSDTETEKTHGKRHRVFVEIRETKKFKSNTTEVKQTSIFLYDSDTKVLTNFPCFRETFQFSDPVEQEEDDCLTSGSQIQYCKEFLEKELEEAILHN